MTDLILLGGGGHCKSVIEVAESSGWRIIGILDKKEEIGKSVFGYNVIGTDEDIPKYIESAKFMITVGFIQDPSIRVKLYNMVKNAGGNLATIVATTAHVSKHATLGEGTVVMNQAVVNSGAEIGIMTIINTFANIEHDVFIGDFCHVSTGGMVNGECKIGNSTFIGSGAVITNGVTITDNVVVGAGAVVCNDIMDSGTYIGVPARKKD